MTFLATNSISPPQKVELSTRIVSCEEWPAIRLIVEQWLELANERHLNADIARFTSLHVNHAEIHKLETSQTIIFSIHTLLLPLQEYDPNDYKKWDTVLVCEDNTSKIQAIALVKMDTLNIAYLATHPDNLISSYRDLSVTPVRGAGSQIIGFVALKALANNVSLEIHTTPDAEKFYQKLGFARITPSEPKLMHLTCDKMRELIRDKKAPFNQ